MGEYIMDIVTLAASRKYTDKKIMESGAVGIKYEIVDSLPYSGKAQTIYFVKNNNSLINDYYDEYVWISSSSAFEKIGSTQIDGSTIQSDWGQNDDTQPDYVKNRPFYTGDPVETALVEESTIAFADDGGGLYQAMIESTVEVTAGETYKVSWDGTVYECPYATVNGLPAIGNLAILNMGPDTGEPFIIGIEYGQGIFIFTTDASASHTFSISRIVAPVVKIDRKYLSISFKPKGESYLTFSSPNKFILVVRDMTKHWDGTLEYFASDETWAIWDGTSVLSAITNGGEYVLYLRGTGNTVIAIDSSSSWHFNGTDIKCIGNIENLLDYATVESGAHPGMSDYCYANMFEDCTSLTQAPELPATTLSEYCYCNMFIGCTSLTHAPALPATTLADYCYQSMFSDCTSLTQPPSLPATSLAKGCYSSMFQNCTSLTQAPVLPATTLADNCYLSMFGNCTSLKLSSTKTDEYTQEYRIPSSGNGTIAGGALANMFINTGGIFKGAPSINTTYYLSSDNMVVRETEIATLNGYIKSMIDAALNKIGVAEEGAY